MTGLRRGKITVTFHPERVAFPVDAYIDGEFAIHRIVLTDGSLFPKYWRLTHIPTGYVLISRLRTIEDAKKAIREFRNVGIDWQETCIGEGYKIKYALSDADDLSHALTRCSIIRRRYGYRKSTR